ncbi:MAG: agmatinase [Planctomycetia bacterium]|nr:agmatinase [Planctomycetia bacterium]
MWNKSSDAFLECESAPEDAKIILFGAPFDSTTSYRPGSRFGSSAIRRESYGLESYSPYQDRDLTDSAILDIGDLNLPIGDTDKALNTIYAQTVEILKAEKLPFMLGGEHLVTLGAFRAVVKKFPDVGMIHLDAHADLREDYLGVTLSHACVIRRCWEIMDNGHIFQFGIRSGDREEFRWGAEHIQTQKFTLDGWSETLEKWGDKPIYLTVDLDVLDPSVFPGTGTPEPGGVSFDDLRQTVTGICHRAHVVGCDVTELSPSYDPSGVSTAVAGKIVREMLLALEK